MGKSLISYGTVTSDKENRDAIEAVSADRLREAARMIFNPETLSTFIYL